jgi:Flp pilus assembly pilin Flp
MLSLIALIAVRYQIARQSEAEGQGLVEYAMLIMLVALACVGAVTGLGTTMKTVFWDVIEKVLLPALGG